MKRVALSMVCIPMKRSPKPTIPLPAIVGDIIKALKSGKYDPREVVVAMSQTGGQCRATNYAALIKRAMVSAGFADVPLITLGVSTKGVDNEQEGFDIPWIRYAKIIVNALLRSIGSITLRLMIWQSS